MRKLTVYTSLFAFAFVMAIGIVVTMSDTALAIGKCEFECLGENRCHYDETGPLCTDNPRTPYYLYFHPSCADGPLDCPGGPYWVGCCAKLEPIPIP